MIDIVGLIAANILGIIAIVIGGTLISISVHFISVGGAPAAMAQATGIGTGTVMLAAGAGIAGIIAAGAVMDLNQNLGVVLGAGAVGAIHIAGTLHGPREGRQWIRAALDQRAISSESC